MRISKSLFPAVALLAAVAAWPDPPAPLGPSTWATAGPGHVWEFPRDHRAHPDYRIEWWYFTGHLETGESPARRFAYQLTFFRIGVLPEPPDLDSAWNSSGLLMAHAALTDEQEGSHRFSELLVRSTPLLAGFGESPEEPLAWSRAPAGTAGRWSLHHDGTGFRFEMTDRAAGFGFALETTPLKPRVLQGPGGLSRKSEQPGAASLYYSFTRLATEGKLTVDGESHDVSGVSWMDHEISSSQLADHQVGWDWFSLQLDDGREVMLYRLRDSGGAVDFAKGTRVGVDGAPEYLEAADFSLESRSSWNSPASAIRYPSVWRIEIDGEAEPWVVVPLVAGQENVSRLPGGPTYWEGAVRVETVEGRRLGLGFVELTGYGEGNRPPV